MTPGRAALIVATDLDGDTREARIRMAVAPDETDLRALYADRIRPVETVAWSRREGRILARLQEQAGRADPVGSGAGNALGGCNGAGRAGGVADRGAAMDPTGRASAGADGAVAGSGAGR
ncbi:hypothetical protein PE067_14475 [Paracoccus sp. DMF-8]|uniref:hypothetical protein n=1 Tax=Paracoccus sp. DMF-8 TaxID=3019445 RepID=UPI0023E3990E|nr:hypothetical protein [Paracoccus sp. DMF-8]MDF3607224.1 hypothetical protein [Paracoccus sp. DMF-8]